MTEIKAPLTDRIKLFLSNHLLLVGLFLFCVVLFFSSCGRAKADGAEPISPYEIQYLEDMMQNWDVYPSNTPVDFTSLYSQFESDCNTYPYYVTNNSNYIIMCKKPSFGLVSQYGSSYSAAGVAFNVDAYPNWQDSFPFIIYQAFSPSSSWQVVNRFYIYDFNGGLTVSPMRFSWTGNNAYNTTSYTRITGFSPNSFSVNQSWYGNVDSFYQCNGSQGTGYSSGWSVSQLDVTPIQIPYTEDSRLKFSTSLRGDGEKLLNTDLSDFVHWGPADDQNISDLVLTLDCDGTEIEFELDDTNSEIINTKNPNYSKRCVYITPFSVFGLDEYEDVTIVKCDFVHTDVNLMGTVVTDYHIACNYILKNETAPIESELIEYDDDTETIKVTTAEIDAKNYVVNMQNYYYSQTGGGGQELEIPEGFTVKLITVYSSGTLADALNNLDNWALFRFPINTLVNLGIVAITDITSISNTNDFNDFMEQDIHDNAYGDYYDIVCYYWVPPSSSGEVDAFYYYITSSGKLRTMSQTLADIWVETNQTAYNTYAIYDYMYTRLNDFEDKSLEAFNDMIFLDRQRNTWLSTVSSGINTLNQTSLNGFVDVVEAINDIDIPVPTPFDDSGILAVLGTIISKLDNIISNQNSPRDGFNSLIAWVKDDTNTDGLYTWINAITTGSDNMMKKVFAVFSLDDLDPDTSGVQTYISYSKSFFDDVSGTGQGTYFRRLFDFNININDWNGGV